jgi:hypothetical protein
MKIRDIITEGDVIRTKFMTALGQKKGMYHNPDIDIPTHPHHEYASFFTKPMRTPGWSYIYGLTTDGQEIRISSAQNALAEVLTGIYNTKGWTDQRIEKVPFTSAFKGKDEE